MRRHPLFTRIVGTLSNHDVAQYRDERLKAIAPSTVVREISLISHILDIAMKEWGVHLPANPARLIRRPTVPNARNRRLKPEEEQTLFAAIDKRALEDARLSWSARSTICWPSPTIGALASAI